MLGAWAEAREREVQRQARVSSKNKDQQEQRRHKAEQLEEEEQVRHEKQRNKRTKLPTEPDMNRRATKEDSHRR